MKHYPKLILIAAILIVTAIMAQDRTYTLKGTAEQMIALRMALEKSKAPYDEVIKVQEWLIPQLIEQDRAFARVDSVSKAIEVKGGKK